MLAVVVVIIVVFGIIFPLNHLYDPLFKDSPAILVKNGSLNVTYSGDFRNITNTNHDFLFSSNSSIATISEQGHSNSTLSISIDRGEIYFDASDNLTHTEFNLTVMGKFNSNLHPISLTVSYLAKGLTNQSTIVYSTNAPPTSSWIPQSKNISTNNLGELTRFGLGGVNVTANLLNDSGKSTQYNFSVSVQMEIWMVWYPDSSHTFVFGSALNGLSKPVSSTIAMEMVEVNM